MIKRNIFHKLEAHLTKKECTVIVGARQTGKTTLIKMLQQHLQEQKQITYSFTLEDVTILNALNEHPENIFRFILKQEQEKTYLFIDEIQYLKNPSNFLKYLYDIYAPNLKIICTGSSAFYIDEKFADSLAGRKKIFELYTLDFEEFLVFNKADDLLIEWSQMRKQSDYISLKRSDINYFFHQYLQYGGYPAVVLAESQTEKEEILKELSNSFLKKDIYEFGILHYDKFFKLLTVLAHQTGSLMNVNELSNTLDISTTTVNHYLHILKKSFHIEMITPFHKNIRKELIKMPKLYFHDLGFRNIMAQNFSSIDLRLDKGFLIENYLFTRLRNLYTAEYIHFWRTSTYDEVDFIYRNENRVLNAIEVKFNEKEYRPSKYKKFVENYPEIPLKPMAYISDNNTNHILGL